MKKLLALLAEKILLNIPWPEVLAEAWKYSKQVFFGSLSDGNYEVLDLQITLELLNNEGSKAIFKKVKKVRYLQENTIAYQDYAWGDGEILLNYKTSIGKSVDKYRQGYKTYVLISLGAEKQRGDRDEFKIQWNIKNGFLDSNGFWETDISQKTKKIGINVIFPRSRIPTKAEIVQTNQRRTIEIPRDSFQVLKDGRIQVSWGLEKPRLYEHYILKWVW